MTSLLKPLPAKAMHFKLIVTLALAIPLCSQALEMNWSGFGTAGYAISNQPYKYQRFIDDKGTLKRDSVVGAQLDLKLNQQWGAAVQAKLAPSDHSDSDWAGSLSWAFIAWRPADDLLIRLGKLRVPLMLNTENQDVGATYDWARLPIEVYSIAPTTDYVGLSISKSWLFQEIDWTLDAYSGKAKNYTRYYGREIRDRQATPGSWFENLDVRSRGLVLTARNLDNVFRAGIHEADASKDDGFISDIPFRTLAPGLGYYDIASGQHIGSIVIPFQNIGASFLLPADIRLTSEYARIKVTSASRGITRWGAYVAISRQFGAWTPYIYYAKTKSSAASLDLYRAVNGNNNPSLPPAIHDYQKFTADIISPYDQSTVALGSSYRLTTKSLIKAEWSYSRTGVVSSFIDAPSGGDSANEQVNIFSLSYNFTF